MTKISDIYLNRLELLPIKTREDIKAYGDLSRLETGLEFIKLHQTMTEHMDREERNAFYADKTNKIGKKLIELGRKHNLVLV